MNGFPGSEEEPEFVGECVHPREKSLRQGVGQLFSSSGRGLCGAVLRSRKSQNFLDTKDIKFGLGLSATHIGDPSKRDRLLLVCALAQALLTLLGAAGKATGLDRLLKVNTSKKRTLSLFRQGLLWYGAIPEMREERLKTLLDAFETILREHAVFAEIFGRI